MPAYCHPPPAAARRLVACLCAEWCSTCRDYRGPLMALAAESADSAFAWVDVEDEAELVGDLEVETFPTVLVQHGESVLFFGPLLPGIDTLRRLLRALDDAGRQPADVDDAVLALAARMACWAAAGRA